MASGITKMEVSIAVQVRAKRDALAFTPFANPPCFHNTKGLCEEIAVFLSSFPSNSWGGKHGFLLLGLGKNKLRIVAGDLFLNCDALKKPNIINPAITDEKKAATSSNCRRNRSGNGWTTSTRSGGKSLSPSFPSNTSSPFTHNTWGTTALPSCNYLPISKNGS